MTVFRRDTHHHTYADYLTWSRTYGDELIGGTAYVREPPSPSASHQMVVVVWLIDPLDRTVKIYRLEAGQYGRATVLDLKGQTTLMAVAGVSIDWDEVINKLA